MITSEGTPHSEETRRKKLLGILGRYYVIAFVIAIAAIFLFGWLADEVLENEFSKVNTNILLAIHAHVSPILTQIALFFTNLGSVIGVVICAAVFMVYLFKKKQKLIAYTCLILLAGASIFVLVLKSAFHQVRPHVFIPLVVETNFSFPSGHAVLSFTLWGFLAWYIISPNHKQFLRWLLGAFCILIAACVALSRLYLGVHWPTDVIAGALVAIFWIAACVTGYEWMKRRIASRRPVLPKGDTPVTPKG